MLAYLKIVVNPKDDESIERVINYPVRGIGDVTVERIRRHATQQGISLFETFKQSDAISTLAAKAKGGISQFYQLLRKYIELKTKISASELARALVDEIGILTEFKMEGTPEALARRENVQELLSAITEYMVEHPDATLDTFLEEVSLVADVDTWDNERNAVTLMTLHSAKGLEFPVVFITGLEEGLFPHSQSLSDRKELEEERRLFYVGITRAMKNLFLTCASQRYRFGDLTYATKSRFLDEIDETLIEFETARHRRREKASAVIEEIEKELHRKRDGKRKKPVTQPAESEYEEYSDEPPLQIGSLVEHETFGRGKIIDLSGYGDGAKAVVQFDGNVRKHLMLKYARLKIVSES